MTADANLALYNSDGFSINSSRNSGTSAEAINTTLNAGTYYARVYSSGSANTYYNLSLSAIPIDSVGNTTNTARNITINSTSITTYSDWVGSPDTNDYYRFSLVNKSNLAIALNGLSADANLQLLQLNSNGTTTQVGSFGNSGTTAEAININGLTAGTYFVRVYQFSGNTDYNLSLSATTFLPPDYAGSTTSTARNITVSSTSTYTDWVGGLDPNDYYRFSLANKSNLAIALNGLSADANLQLLRLNSNGTTTQVGSSGNTGTTAEAININGLAAGTYFVRIYQFSGNTYYNLSLQTTAPVADWFSQNLRDAEIVNLARNLASDGQLSRNDMLAIFRSAEDDSLIDFNEQLDLKTLVNNSTRFNMTDSVRYLSAQVANGTATNMSASLFESNLVGRWFLGTVAPTAKFNAHILTDTQVQGSLFGSSGQARIGDIDQGSFGDCAFLAALGATFGRQSNDSGNQSSSVINSMITDNGDNTYTMRFYSNGSAEYVTVDRRLATYNGQLFGARSTDALWVPLVERAYAQWLEGREGTPGYNRIGNGDNLANPLSFVTGRNVVNYSTSSITFTQLQTALNNRQAVETATFYHAYSVTNAYTNSSGQQRVIVRNPYGFDDFRLTSGNPYDGFVDLSFDEFRSTFLFGITIA